MNLEQLIRYTLAAYLACGAVNALWELLSNADTLNDSSPRNSTSRVAVRVFLTTLRGFLPAILHLWRFALTLPSALRIEWQSQRRAVKLETEMREWAVEAKSGVATYDPRDEVTR